MQFGPPRDPDHSNLRLIRSGARRVAVAMPDPSEPSPRRPERPDRRTPAPNAVRRRVMARVHAQPEPVAALALHRARRLLATRRAVATAIAILTGLLLVLALSLPGGEGRRAPPTYRSAQVRLTRSAQRAELHLLGMAQPPIGEVYEVWVTGSGGAAKPTDALFTPTSAGSAAVEVPGSLRGITAITVTAEPRGGSSQPTGPVVIRVPL